jgi:GR25 family glycosyltransferase involved in LPS biosynthesis
MQQWNNIPTFVINTNDEIGNKRLPLIQAELRKYNIDFKLVNAIKNKNGAKGLLLTMKKLFDSCIENNEQNILVFEDDAVFINENVNEIMNAAMQQLPKDFLYLALGYNLLLPPTRESENLIRIQSSYSTHASVYIRKVIELILKKWNEEKPYDIFLLHNIQIYGSCYGVFPIVCSQRTGISNIFEYNPEKQIGIEKYYNVGTKEINWGLMMKERYEELTKNI